MTIRSVVLLEELLLVGDELPFNPPGNVRVSRFKDMYPKNQDDEVKWL